MKDEGLDSGAHELAAQGNEEKVKDDHVIATRLSNRPAARVDLPPVFGRRQRTISLLSSCDIDYF